MKNIITVTIFFVFFGLFDSGVLGAAGPPEQTNQKESQPNGVETGYDPYLLSATLLRARRGSNNKEMPVVRTQRQQRELYDPFYLVPVDGITRSRRNSQTYYAPYSNYDRRRDVEYLYERNAQVDDNNNIFPDRPAQPVYSPYRNPNQFLTKSQIFGSPTRNNVVLARYYSPNAIDHRKPSYHDQGNRYYGAADRNRPSHGYGREEPHSNEAWSIQVGTQLKVHDDGREKNPEQFYVRDESRRGSGSQRRYSPYYRK